jgi:hypothetical protein
MFPNEQFKLPFDQPPPLSLSSPSGPSRRSSVPSEVTLIKSLDESSLLRPYARPYNWSISFNATVSHELLSFVPADRMFLVIPNKDSLPKRSTPTLRYCDQ